MRKSGLVTTLAIIGLVLGALGFLVSLIPCVGWLGILGSGPAFVLSLVALISASTKHAPKGLAIAAVSVSAVGVSFPVLKLLLLAALLGGSSRISRPALNSLQEAINKNQALLGETDKKRKTVLENALSKYPPPQFPMDLNGWILSPDKTAAIHAGGREVREFRTGKTLRLIAEGRFREVTEYGFDYWSPDSKWIVYWNNGLCYVSRDGKINRRLSDQRLCEWPAFWQPGSNATLLLFDKPRLLLYPIGKNTARVIATAQEEDPPMASFAPNGRWIFYNVYKRQKPHFGISEPLSLNYVHSSGAIHFSYLDVQFEELSMLSRWSSDSNAVLARVGDILVLLHLPTGRPTPLCIAARVDGINSVPNTYDGRNVVLSPDCGLLAFIGGEFSFTSGVTRHLACLNIQDKNLKRLDASRFYPEHLFSFSPNGRFLAFDGSAIGEGGRAASLNRYVGVLDLETSKLTRFKLKDLDKELPGLKDSGLDPKSDLKWQVPVFNNIWWSADGKALQGSTDDRLVFEFTPDGRRFERIWPDKCKVPFMTMDQLDLVPTPLGKETLGEVPAKIVPVSSVAQDVPFQVRELPVQVTEVK